MRNILRSLTLVLASVWVYFPCLNGSWLWDDGLEVTQNSLLRDPNGWWEAWLRPDGMDYFPLKATLQWVEWHLWGAHPLGYHLVNLGLHIASAFLVWRLFHLFGLRLAFLGGLLFALHPLAVESVAWISEFKNTASLPPLLLAAIAYVRYDRGAGRAAWTAALVWFAAALACKTSVVMFPVVILAYAGWRHGSVRRADFAASIPFFLAAAAMGAATVWFQSVRAIGASAPTQALATRLGQAGSSIVAYASACVWPAQLEPIYPRADAACPAWIAWVLIAALLMLAWIRRATWGRHALLAAGWFLLNLVPALGLVPMAYQRISPRADHFAYVSLVGFAAIAVAALGAAMGAWERRNGPGLRSRIPFAAVAAAALGALALQAHAYAAVFTGEKVLWSYAVARNPRAWLARNNLGRVYLQEQRPAEAAAQFQEAARIQPDSPEAHANLGNALELLRKPAQARSQYEEALRIDPGLAGVHYDLGLSLLRSRQMAEAAREFKIALRIEPGRAPARNSLGLALAGLGRPSEAAEQFRLAIELDPSLPEPHLNLGNALFRQGRLEDAEKEYRRAIRLDPSNPGAHNNLAYALSRLGRQAEAKAEFNESRRLANH